MLVRSGSWRCRKIIYKVTHNQSFANKSHHIVKICMRARVMETIFTPIFTLAVLAASLAICVAMAEKFIRR